jgi:hypothetical protein
MLFMSAFSQNLLPIVLLFVGLFVSFIISKIIENH